MDFINTIEKINNIFTTREQATIIWCIIIGIFCIRNDKIRGNLNSIIKQIIKLLIKIPILVMIIYIVGLGTLLYKLGYLESIIIKDYIYWVIFGFIPILFRIIENSKTITLKQIILDVIKFSIIPLFIINSYTMNLIVELLIIPLVVICSGCLVICDYKYESPDVKKVFNTGLIVISIMIIYYGFKGFFINIDDIKYIEFWKSISIDVVCILGTIPIIFYFRLYILYEQVGLRVSIRCKLNKWIIYLVLLKNCVFSRKKLIVVLDNTNRFYRIESWRDLDNRVKSIFYKETCNI